MKLTQAQWHVLSDALQSERERLEEEAGLEDPPGEFSDRLEALDELEALVETIEVL